MGADSCDVVIVGSGIGGLTCGVALAKGGLNVVLCEQHHSPGGYCSFFRRRGYVFDAGAHLLGCVGNSLTPLGRFFRDIQFDGEFIPVNPMDRVHFPDRNIEVPANIFDYVDMLQREFPDERQIEAFFKEVRRIYRSFLKQGTIAQYRSATFSELLEKYFQNRRLMAILSSQWGYMGLPPRRISAVAMCVMLSTYLFDGAYYPKGGIRGFIDAFVQRFENFGGKLLLSRRVKNILIDGRGKATGVSFEGGDSIRAGAVVSNADVLQTMKELIEGSDETRQTDYIRDIQKMEKSISPFITYLGVDMDPAQLQGKAGWYFQSYNMEDPENLPVYVSIPTLWDVDRLSPTKHSIVIMTMPGKDAGPWSEAKRTLEKEVLHWICGKVPDLERHIVVKESATPATLHRYTLNSSGAIYGWAMTPEQMDLGRPQNQTPIQGLFLAGHWTWPAGGVASVMFSGLRAARLVSEYWKENRS